LSIPDISLRARVSPDNKPSIARTRCNPGWLFRPPIRRTISHMQPFYAKVCAMYLLWNSHDT
jgi:hypothetical protein